MIRLISLFFKVPPLGKCFSFISLLTFANFSFNASSTKSVADISRSIATFLTSFHRSLTSQQERGQVHQHQLTEVGKANLEKNAELWRAESIFVKLEDAEDASTIYLLQICFVSVVGCG